MTRAFASNGPTLHELEHRWGAYLDSNLGFGNLVGGGHWGMVGSGRGQRGGFDPATLVDNGNNSYTVGGFGLFANGGDSVNFAMLELYIMGLADASEVPAIPVPINPTNLSCPGDTCTFNATGINNVSVADIVAAHGARSPAFGVAQTAFTTAFVVASEQAVSPETLAFFNEQAKILALPQGVSTWLKSWADATLGRSTMTTTITPPSSP